MSNHRPLLSVVCPAYQEQEVLPLFHPRLMAVLEGLRGEFDVEVIYVDDGSTDGTLGVLRQLAVQDKTVSYLSLSRNFGHQAALTAGLEHAKGDIVVSLDSDLQHPPAVILELIEKWREGCEIVLTERVDSQDAGLFKRSSSRAFYLILGWLSETEIRPGASDFRLMTRQALDSLLRLRESHRFLRGLVSWLGYKVGTVPYQAADRAAGRSQYSLKRMARLARDGILSFSIFPLRIPLLLGLLVLAVAGVQAIGLAGFVALGSAVNWPYQVLLFTVIVLGGFILVSLGIVGAYVGYLTEQVKQRPTYLLRDGSARRGSGGVTTGTDQSQAA